MASTINSDNGVVSGSSGLKSTADTSGVLALQSNGTTGLTLNTSLALGVGSGNSTGSSGQVLTSAGSGAAPTWATPTVTSPAGSNTQIQYNNSGSFGASSTLTYDGNVITNTQANGTNSYIRTKSGTVDAYYGAATSGLGTIGVAGTFSNNDLALYANSAERFRIGTAGELGIGGATYGTSGQVLTSGGSGAAPTWATPAAGGSLILVTTATGTSTSQVDLTSGLTSTYPVYKLYVNYTASSSTSMEMRFYLNGSVITSPSGYYSTYTTGTAGSNFSNGYVSGQSVIPFSNGGRNVSWEFTIFEPTSTTRPPLYFISSLGASTSNNGYHEHGMCGYDMSSASGALTGFRFTFGGSSVSTFAARLYGIKT